jgi:hypothetical protein
VALEKVKTLGGTVVVPPVPIPTGTFAWFANPRGKYGGAVEAEVAAILIFFNEMQLSGGMFCLGKRGGTALSRWVNLPH